MCMNLYKHTFGCSKLVSSNTAVRLLSELFSSRNFATKLEIIGDHTYLKDLFYNSIKNNRQTEMIFELLMGAHSKVVR